MTYFVLLEDSSYLLQETGDKIILDDAYQLSGENIPRPKTLSREYIKLKADYTALTGKVSQDYSYSKEKYLLGWEMLSKEEADNILSIVNLNKAVSFSVIVGNLNIPLVDVIPYIKSMEYSVIGDNYYVSLALELIEQDMQ